jgi:hypothetical protein
VQHISDIVTAVRGVRSDLNVLPGDQQLWIPLYRSAEEIEQQSQTIDAASSQSEIITAAIDIVAYVKQNPLH